MSVAFFPVISELYTGARIRCRQRPQSPMSHEEHLALALTWHRRYFVVATVATAANLLLALRRRLLDAEKDNRDGENSDEQWIHLTAMNIA